MRTPNKDIRLVKRLLNNFFKKYLKFDGIYHYSYNVIKKNDFNYNFYISTYPKEWLSEYCLLKLQFIDPVFTQAMKTVGFFYWGEDIASENTCSYQQAKSMMFTLSKKHGVNYGCTYVLHDPYNNLATFTISSREMNLVIKKIHAEHIYIHDFLSKIHAKYIDILCTLNCIHSKDRFSLNINSENNSIRRVHLSQLEVELMELFKLGHNFYIISREMDIPMSTIKKMTRRICHKYNSPNLSHALIAQGIYEQFSK